ncbi:unnamed protein product [Dracunculus medinensis]|uniref:TPT domain-containing protein n=1 Tax=Dracunculus medinensis TaxID=318479 RepID=A0A0N4UQU5_DRAME|nr:unnamed protein product [Dracunculus medinensis]
MKFTSTEFHFGLQIVLLCCFWYFVSSAASIINKITLQVLMHISHVRSSSIPFYYMVRFVLPSAVGKAIAVASGFFSLYKIPVSYLNTVKATLPFFAVFSARVVLHEKQTRAVYLSLIPIIIGVFIASLTEVSFNMSGLISALISTALYALLNVYVKRVLLATDVHPLTLLVINSQIATVVFFPFWCIYDGFAIWNDFHSSSGTEYSTSLPDVNFVLLLMLSSLFSFFQNLCAFFLMHKLTAVSYAVANTTKRISVIGISLLTLRNPVTILNFFGMTLAVGGIYLYNQAKQSQKLSSQGLPLSVGDFAMSSASLADLPNKPLSVERNFDRSDKLSFLELSEKSLAVNGLSFDKKDNLIRNHVRLIT